FCRLWIAPSQIGGDEGEEVGAVGGAVAVVVGGAREEVAQEVKEILGIEGGVAVPVGGASRGGPGVLGDIDGDHAPRAPEGAGSVQGRPAIVVERLEVLHFPVDADV